MTTSAPPPDDPELAADPDYRQAAAEDWWGRVADYYADQQARGRPGGPVSRGPVGSGRPGRRTWSSTASRSTTPSRIPPPRRVPAPPRSCPRPPSRRPSRPNRRPGHDQQVHVSAQPHRCRMGAWAEGGDLEDILAARPRPSLAARIAEFFKSEPEAGL